MRKLFAIGAIASFIVVAVLVVSCKDKSSETKTTDNKDSTEKMLKRGEYLAMHVAACLDCHSTRDFTKFSGPVVPGTEGGGGWVFDEKLGLPGAVPARNITPDAETGIGTWTDDEVLRAITQGISKNGDTLFPIMPYVNFNRMAKDDLLSIIAYIRTLKPIKNKIGPRTLMIPIAAAYPGPALQPSVDGNVRPPESDKVKYGEYIALVADCATCHSPLGPHGPDMAKAFSGGYPFQFGKFFANSANITPDTATGIGSWDETRFMNKFLPYREEKNWNFVVEKENTIMPLSMLAGITDNDLKALYAYLRTVPAISHKVEKFPSGPPPPPHK